MTGFGQFDLYNIAGVSYSRGGFLYCQTVCVCVWMDSYGHFSIDAPSLALIVGSYDSYHTRIRSGGASYIVDHVGSYHSNYGSLKKQITHTMRA